MKKERQHERGPVGECICPKCEARIAHRRGIPCLDERCSECGAKMLQGGSDDYQLWAAKKSSQT